MDSPSADERSPELRFTVLPSAREVTSRCHRTFAEALRENGIAGRADCGSMGTCGQCRIRFVSQAPPPSPSGRRLISAEALAAGWRLACQQPVLADASIEIAEPQASDPAGPAKLLEAPSKRSGREGSPLNGRGIGVAIDVGTTTLAVYLFDLSNGTLLGSAADYNPQRTLGADVISRIGIVRTRGAAGLEQLQQSVIEGLNGQIQSACEQAGTEPTEVLRAVVAGNPTMLHLFMGVSPVGIDQSPFEAAFLGSVTVAPTTIGLEVHPEAEVQLLPGASSYLGSDVVVGVLATSLGEGGATELLIDIGTNGEIVLAHGGRFAACSTAAGPAFEGAAIRDGMTAVPGAIEDVRITGSRVATSTIGDAPAVGLCGTGLIGAVHELLQEGAIDASGKLLRDHRALSEFLVGEGRDLGFFLGRSPRRVTLYQEDIRSFQLGKAAIRAGIDTLLDVTGVVAEDLERVYVAGAFGTHLQPQRALGTGLLPTLPTERIYAVGNTAGQGAVMVLLDRSLLSTADALAKRIETIELAAIPEFARRYIDRMAFPEP